MEEATLTGNPRENLYRSQESPLLEIGQVCLELPILTNDVCRLSMILSWRRQGYTIPCARLAIKQTRRELYNHSSAREWCRAGSTAWELP